MRQSIEAFPDDLRVGLLASGGMSHFVVDEELDRGLLQALADKDMAHLAALDPRRLKAGSSEIRNWIIVASAVQHLDLRWSSYTPAYRTPALSGTGLGFAHWY
jgi:3-O-methylgallate 3,4-dioxygenase